MSDKPYILGIVAARAGSKGVPGKNVRLLQGRPLLQWIILSAKKSTLLNDIIFTSDSKEYGKFAADAGADVPFIRPSELASDTAVDLDVMKHAVEWMEKNRNIKVDIIVRMQPTNPTYPTELIDEAIDTLLENPSLDSVRPIAETPKHPLKMWRKSSDGAQIEPYIPESLFEIKDACNMGRQMLPEAFIQVGAIDVLWRKTLIEKNSMKGDNVGFVMVNDPLHTVNIDTEMDFKMAEFAMSAINGS